MLLFYWWGRGMSCWQGGELLQGSVGILLELKFSDETSVEQELYVAEE